MTFIVLIIMSLTVIVTLAGHSLGGALATLCAFDIAAAVKEAGAVAESGRAIDVCCYTFGAPRTGNRAFRNEFNELVPNCWGIINDQVWSIWKCTTFPFLCCALMCCAALRCALHVQRPHAFPGHFVIQYEILFCSISTRHSCRIQ